MIKVNGVLYHDEFHYKYVEGYWPKGYERVQEGVDVAEETSEKKVLVIEGQVYESAFEYWYKTGIRPKEVQYIAESELANQGRRK